MDNSQQLQNSSSERQCNSSIDKFNFQDYKFYSIKSTEETKTGFPILPAALNELFNNTTYIPETTKSTCNVPLRTLPDNAEEILVPGIRSFLKRCYNDTDKRRRSSRVCKHKPGVKHYCSRKNWNTILAKYKTEILENPLLNLGSFSKNNNPSLNKELFNDKQNISQNKINEPLVLNSQKENIPHTDNSNKNIESHTRYPNYDISHQNGSSTSPNTNCVPYQNVMDDISSFLAIFGLKRKVSQTEIVNSDDLKLVPTNAETSNNEEAKTTSNLVNISGGTEKEIKNVDETTSNKECPDMSSVAINLAPERNLLEENKSQEYESLRNDEDKQCVENQDGNGTHSEQNPENFENTVDQKENAENNKNNAEGDTLTISSPQESLSHNENISHVNPVGETSVSFHSPASTNNFLVENLIKNGTWCVTSGPQVHSSPRKTETKEQASNDHDQEVSGIRNRVPPNFQGPIPMHHGSQTSTPRHMYSQTSGMNGVFPNFYVSPCIPAPILASQLVPPILAYNFLPMNNVLNASHPGIMPFTNNGAYVSTAFDYTSQHGIHHSLPLPFHSAQSSPSTLYHKPGIHQWVNVNASTVLPTLTQGTFMGGTHLPCCGRSSHPMEARSQLHYSSGFYPSEGCNAFFSHPLNSDVRVGSDLTNVTSRNSSNI